MSVKMRLEIEAQMTPKEELAARRRELKQMELSGTRRGMKDLKEEIKLLADMIHLAI